MSLYELAEPTEISDLIAARHRSASLLIGSQNASFISLQDNQEMSLLLNDASASTLMNRMAATFITDFAHAAKRVTR